MSSYLMSWLSYTTPESSNAPESTPSILTSPPKEDSDDEDNETIKGDKDDDDLPPAFPSLNSVQRLDYTPRVSEPSSTLRILNDTNRMPPPPLPSLASRRPGVGSTSSSNFLAAPSAAHSLAVPLTTTKAPSKKASGKVALAPGHGPLDWANLKKSGIDLRGVDTLQRVTLAMLKQHNKRDDAWSAFGGKVYNITAYLPYHPGGEKELMRVAGRDGSKLFALTHSWVNIDYMLEGCLVGFLVPGP